MSPPSFLELQRQQFPAVLPEGKCPVALSPRLASPPIPAGLHQQLQRSSPDRRRFCRSRIPYPEIPVPWLPQVAAAATSTRLAPNPSRSPRRLPHPAHHDRHGTPESDPAARPRMSCPVPPISTGFRFASRAHQKTRSAPARRTSAGRHLWNPPTFFCRRLLCAPGTVSTTRKDLASGVPSAFSVPRKTSSVGTSFRLSPRTLFLGIVNVSSTASPACSAAMSLIAVGIGGDGGSGSPGAPQPLATKRTSTRRKG